MITQRTASRRHTNRLDGLGQTQYRYAVLGNGLSTFTEDGPWASDEVTVTNRYGRRAGLRLAQPTGAFVVTHAWDAAGRWWVVGGTAGTFTYAHPADSAGTLPMSPTLAGWNYVTNISNTLTRIARTEPSTRGRDLSGTVAGANGIGGLLAHSHGYSGGNWTSHTFYHADGNGNVTALVNSTGTLQAGYRYDPYGRWLSGGGTLASANGLRFSSKPWVGFAGSTTRGLYYYGYRFYDPYLQRWVNRDPIQEKSDRNLYKYAKNNPIIVIDATGLSGSNYKDGYKECIEAVQTTFDYCVVECNVPVTFLTSYALIAEMAAPGVGIITGGIAAVTAAWVYDTCLDGCRKARDQGLQDCEEKYRCPQN